MLYQLSYQIFFRILRLQIYIVKFIIHIQNWLNLQPIIKPQILNKTIIFLGYMGCGKSIIGSLLSRALNLPYIDLDSYIETQEKKPIKELFNQEGEIYFRQRERFYLEELLNKDEQIILALGGGTPCYFDSMDYIVNSGVISIYLKASISTLAKRLMPEKSLRPLISHINDEENLMEFIGKHLFERLPFYGKATHTISVDKGTPAEIVEKIKYLI